eukprot:COSAG03_NODE_4506_length_1528_cov_45.931421_2_plen_194_part_00
MRLSAVHSPCVCLFWPARAARHGAAARRSGRGARPVPQHRFIWCGGRCASLALAPLPLIFSYKSEKSLCGTGDKAWVTLCHPEHPLHANSLWTLEPAGHLSLSLCVCVCVCVCDLTCLKQVICSTAGVSCAWARRCSWRRVTAPRRISPTPLMGSSRPPRTAVSLCAQAQARRHRTRQRRQGRHRPLVWPWLT